jgi:hypothetical protein
VLMQFSPAISSDSSGMMMQRRRAGNRYAFFATTWDYCSVDAV